MKYKRIAKRNVFVRQQRALAEAAARAAEKRAERGRSAERARSRLAPASREYRRRVRHFPAPTHFNLSGSYADTVRLLMQFRRWVSPGGREHPFYLDLRPVRQISPAGALLLVAELHRWKLIYNRSLRARDVSEWDPNVLRLLGDMGFFELLAVDKAQIPKVDLSGSKMEFLPFCCGSDTNGLPILELRDMLEKAVGRLKKRLAFYQGVSEAITNVRHHAYAKKNALSRWWMSASIDWSRSVITVMVLDHGLGIPRTLPRKTLGEQVKTLIRVGSFDRFADDGQMIEAAVTLGRSSVQEPNRGHGLSRDIISAIESFDGAARVRIVSNRGRYTFTREMNGTTSSSVSNAVQSLDGTFVEWTFHLPQMSLSLQ